VLPKRLIIHLDNVTDADDALRKIAHCLPKYYQYKIQDNRRLTAQFDSQGVLIIYHDASDAVIWSFE